jgi:DNA-binding beta-propeller fold protein YncE
MTDLQTNDAVEPQRPRKSRQGRRILGLVLIVLILLLAAVSVFLFKLIMPAGKIASDPKEAGGLEWVRSIYGWGRAKSRQMTAPNSVAVGPDGTIWTVNPGTMNVIGYNPDGSYRTTLTGSKTKLIAPTDVGTDPAGNVYVAENTANRIIVLTPQNQELRVLRVQTPTAVTANADRIVVGSVGGFAILDKEGNAVKVVGQKGKGDKDFDGVNGVAIGRDGSIYVVDTYNNRLSAYDRLGNRLWIVKTGNPGNQSDINKSMKAAKPSGTEANLQLPEQATVDANGRLVVVDAFDFTLNVFDPKNGRLIHKYGAYGAEDGKLLYPSGVAYDASRDWFSVADSGNDRVQVFRIPGSAPGNTGTTINRLLAGPIRACLVPLALLLLALLIAGINRARKRRAPKQGRVAAPEAA